MVDNPIPALGRSHPSSAAFQQSSGIHPEILTAISAIACITALAGCQSPAALKGGSATTAISQPGRVHHATLAQSENPRESSRQTVQSEQVLEYVLPAGTAIPLDLQTPGSSAPPLVAQSEPAAAAVSARRPPFAYLDKPLPVRSALKDRTETWIGAAQSDTVRAWAGKAATMRPVLWAGLAMMTLVAGIFVYFGWWTKAGLALAVGAGMIILAQTLPEHGGTILLGGLAVFGMLALLVLYAYHKGKLDQDHNGVLDLLEKRPGNSGVRD